MARSYALEIKTPGAAPSADDLAARAAQENGSDAEQTKDLTVGDDVEALKEQLAALQARNAELLADIESKKKSNIIYEPETPHAAERLAASATSDMTVAQVMAAIDAKKLPEPMTNYLCADGTYCRRS
jgi:molybdopterin converting factor small subunit